MLLNREPLMTDQHRLPWPEYEATLQPHEKPMLVGSPATPDHAVGTRLLYAAVGLLVTMTGGLGNAVITANLASFAGSLGITVTEAAWLPIAFVMTNACMNLLLIKFRMQYGLQLFTRIMLGLFVAATFAHLFVDDLRTAVAVRAVAGVCAAGMSTLGILYLIQAFPAAHRLKGLVIGIGLASFSGPAARVFSSHLLEIAEWRGLHLFELGLALVSLTAVLWLRLPPAQKTPAFEPLDFVTFALFAPGIALLCAVLGLGRTLWWTETTWIGWATIGSILLLSTALMIEHGRRNPLINLAWLGSEDILRLALSILLIRVVLSEQTSGAVGLVQQLGVGGDQLRGLFAIILAATCAGTLVSAFTLNMAKLYKPLAISLALIAIGALIDSHATVLTRPINLYFSQALLAFAAALFIGPALMIGLVQLLTKGFHNLISFIVVFSIGQAVGGLAGPAIVGTIQTQRERLHLARLSESITLGDPQTVLRLQQLGGAYGRVLGDVHLREVEALRLLQQQVAQQAHVLAYNDVFLLIAIAAAIGCLWTTFVHFRHQILTGRVAASADVAVAAAVD